MSYHRTYYSICFLEFSNENYKALHTWHRILTTKTPQHRIGLRHLGIIEKYETLKYVLEDMFLPVLEQYAYAQCKTLDFTAGAACSAKSGGQRDSCSGALTQIVHPPQPCVIPYIRPLSPSQVSVPTTLYDATQKLLSCPTSVAQ